MKRTLLIALIFILPIAAFSQGYNFELVQGTYTDLVDPISINNGLAWDDPEFVLPIGFDFFLFDKEIDTLFVRDGELVDNNGLGGFALITFFELDLIDRAFDIYGEEGQPGGISPISYQLSGNSGNQILKIEWKNAGLYDDVDENGTSTDFANVQIWLYEGSDKFEIHFGASSLTKYLEYLAYEGDPFELNVAFDAYVSPQFGHSPFALAVGGDPANPEFGKWSMVEHLTGSVPDGTIYRFEKATTSTTFLQEKPNAINILPNPVMETFQIEKSITDLQIKTIQIFHANGQMIKNLSYRNEVNISDLSAGCYFVKFVTDQGILTKRIIKM